MNISPINIFTICNSKHVKNNSQIRDNKYFSYASDTKKSDISFSGLLDAIKGYFSIDNKSNVLTIKEYESKKKKDLDKKIKQLKEKMQKLHFGENLINSFVNASTSDNIDFTLSLPKKYYTLTFVDIVQTITPLNESVAQKTYDKIAPSLLKDFLKNITPQNVKYVNNILNAKPELITYLPHIANCFKRNENDENFNTEFVSKIIKLTELIKSKYVPVKVNGQLINYSYDDEGHPFLIDNANPYNIDLLTDVFNNKGKIPQKIAVHINKDNFEFAYFVFENPKILKKYDTCICSILRDIHPWNTEFIKELCQNTDLSKSQVASILKNITQDNVTIAKQLCAENIFPIELQEKILKFTTKESKETIEEVVIPQIKKCYNHPELYENGIAADLGEGIIEINDFFEENMGAIVHAGYALGGLALDELMRERLDGAEDYLSIIVNLIKNRKNDILFQILGDYASDMNYTNFESGNLKLLKEMCQKPKPDGSDFAPKEKMNMAGILYALLQSKSDLYKLKSMLYNGYIDIEELQSELLNHIATLSGMEKEDIKKIPINIRNQWDLKHLHLLANELSDSNDNALVSLLGDTGRKRKEDSPLKTLINVTNRGEFKTYIHDTSNPYGQTNKKTQKAFEKSGLDYFAWLKTNEDCNVIFKSSDKNLDILNQFAKQILEDIEKLRKTPAKNFIDKNFSDFINNNDKFVIPENIRNNKTNLENFIKDILHKLNSLWERANTNQNSNDEKIRARARSVLTIKSHLETKFRDIQAMKPVREKSINWKIKMWDRNPQKDIFQGNYSTCCIGMNEINSSAMPNYILNTMFNMIEIVDNNTGRTVGNALCYYAKNISNEIYFVIDNIEINNHYKLSDKRGEELRNSIKKFAQNINKEVSGKDNIPIILGGEDLNDVPTNKLKEKHNVLSKLGSMNCEEIYADLFGGWSDMQTDSTSYYQL